jgi:hypothetical protein
VGLDSYGDWYRRARDAQALIVPGPNTVTNAAHSVPFDFLAYGGFPLFIAYLSFILVGLVALIKVVRRQKEFDWVFENLLQNRGIFGENRSDGPCCRPKSRILF